MPTDQVKCINRHAAGLEADEFRGVVGAGAGRERHVPGELLEVLVEKLLAAGQAVAGTCLDWVDLRMC